MIASWLSIIIPALIAVLAAGVTFGVVKNSTRETAVGLAALTVAVNSLITQAAVNISQYNELSRRLVDFEHRLGEHSEQIRRLRLKVHMASNKLMELDPKWKPYHDEE